MTIKQPEREFFTAKGFGSIMGFGRKPAIIAIDLLYAFTDPASDLGSDLTTVIDNTNVILDAAHARKHPVIFTTVVYEDDKLRDAGLWALKQRGCKDLRPGSRAIEIDQRLHRTPADILLLKKGASCFFGTNLVPLLLSANVDTVILTGCSTSGCVRATAVDACQYGFRPMIVRQAVGDRSQAAHEQSLFDLHSRYGDVVDLDDVLSHFSTAATHSGH
jgi:nicotinamidase-related amidase